MFNQTEQTQSTTALQQILQLLTTLPETKLMAMLDYLYFLHTSPQHLQATNGNGVVNEQGVSGQTVRQTVNNHVQTGYDILLTKQANDGYLARPLLMPEVVVTGKDEVEALVRVGEAIVEQQKVSRIVHITIPIANGTQPVEEDPMLRFAGMWGDDPNWDQFQADIAAYRRAIDLQTDPDLLPLPE